MCIHLTCSTEDASESLANVAATSAQAAQAARFRETHQVWHGSSDLLKRRKSCCMAMCVAFAWQEMLRDFKRVAQSIDQQYQHARQFAAHFCKSRRVLPVSYSSCQAATTGQKQSAFNSGIIGFHGFPRLSCEDPLTAKVECRSGTCLS